MACTVFVEIVRKFITRQQLVRSKLCSHGGVKDYAVSLGLRSSEANRQMLTFSIFVYREIRFCLFDDLKFACPDASWKHRMP
jgi:hypothetical protein